ncbi:MAG: phytanoyl-CoA dioxygenase family protein [Armatimonadota bacterium]
MTIDAALTELGATAGVLTREEEARLDRDGYLVLPGILSPATVDAMNAVLDALVVSEGEHAGKEVHQEAGTNRLSNLVDKSGVFDVCFTHPRVLAGIARVLRGDLKLSSLNYRAALPGEGLQGLHCDWSGPVVAGDYHVCNSIWLLDEFTSENGATRVVPGTHDAGRTPQESMPDPSAPHPDEVLLTAPAGTVVVFNSHTWHGGTRNRTDRPRRALHSYFCRRSDPQQLDQRSHVGAAARARLGAAARTVLDLD